MYFHKNVFLYYRIRAIKPIMIICTKNRDNWSKKKRTWGPKRHERVLQEEFPSGQCQVS